MALAGLFLTVTGCSKDIQNKEAVRQGVLDYLKKTAEKTGLNPDGLDVEIGAVTFRQNEADATVVFRPKGADPAQAGMAMKIDYTLERKGDVWSVRGKRTAAGAPAHGAGMPLPDGGAPGGGAPTGAMPPGHPAIPAPPNAK